MSSRKRVQGICEFLADGLSLLLSTGVTILIFGINLNKLPEYELSQWFSYALLLLLSYLTVFVSLYSSINMVKRSRIEEFLSIVKNSVAIFSILALLLLISKNPIIESRFLFLGIFLFNIPIDSIIRFRLKRYLMKFYRYGKHANRVCVITTTDRAKLFVENLDYDWTRQITGIIFQDAELKNGKYIFKEPKDSILENKLKEQGLSIPKPQVIQDTHYKNIPIVCEFKDCLEWFLSSPCDEVFINLPMNGNDDEVLEFIEELESMGATIHINVPSLEKIIESRKYENFDCGVKGGFPIATLRASTQDSNMLILKRFIDIVGSFFGLLISTPIILAVSIPLLLESKGPLFFKQKRVGKNGRTFNIYKLRSMYIDAEERKKELEKHNKMDGLMFKVEDDPRITKVGKFIRRTSIDELPQFLNVLKGDMSLVGTRPPTVDEFKKYENRHKRRLSMRPGITGMWQVSGRSQITNFEEVVALDLSYIDNWSIGLDIQLLFKTVKVVCKKDGAE